MVSKALRNKIEKMYYDGIETSQISETTGIPLEEVENIIANLEEEIDDSKKESNKKDIEDRMDTTAEGTITSEIVRRTKGVALATQKAKEELGDYIFHLFDNTGVPAEQIAGFAEYAIEFFIANHNKIEELQSQLDVAEEMIEELYAIADVHASKERIVREYVQRCATEGTPVDKEFVQEMLSNKAIYTSEE
jgi:hypothetical protein